jgi:hypothetical protein
MSRLIALSVGIAALTVVSTVAEARDGCGRGFYYNGRRCVPQPQYDPGYDYRYRPYPRREPGVSVDVGPNLRLNFGERPGPGYYCRYGEC